MVLNLKARLRRRVPIVGADDARWSVISSIHDQKCHGDDELIGIALDAAQRARTIDLSAVARRCTPREATWVLTWPGEHYRLLAALADILQPATIVEVGTYKGHGALALAAGNPKSKVVTYDIVPWTEINGASLKDADLAPAGRIEQRIGDLGDEAFRTSQLPTLAEADLIFIDGPKDGEWEERTLPHVLWYLSDRRRVVVLDDIRLMEMVQFWRDLTNPKLDVTSIGHWSGTGLLFTV